VAPSCSSNGSLAFANIEGRSDAWVLPIDLNAGKPTGPMERITGPSRWRETLSLSANGRYLAFASYQSGQQSVWLRELETGKELSVAESPFTQRYPVANASGTRIAFSVYEKDKRVVYASSPGGAPEKLCEGCLRATDWSLDSQRILVFAGDPYQINILDIASRKQTPLVTHPHYPVLYGRLSPDNNWVSFTARIRPGHGLIAVAPVDGTKPVAESAWITIAEAASDDYANWSPDGKTLYFTSGQDGYNCLWAQRIDGQSHRPLGEAFAVQHFHGSLPFQHGGWSAADGRITISLAEKRSSIWLMSRSGWGGALRD
jgi:Tol biopolymer transport system component